MLFSCLIYTCIAIGLFFIYWKYLKSKAPKNSIGLFHPFCNQGGGGEKVLYSILRSLQNDDLQFFIYTGDKEANYEII